MKEAIIELFREHQQMAVVISIFISVLIAVLGIVPSFFITAANILFFGFWQGTLISFIGEAVGALVAFLLYRKGFKKAAHNKLEKFPKLVQLVDAQGRPAFLLILALRLIPFVPSGLVTFAAAIGKVTLTVFLIASSIGKVPALLIEAYSVYQVTSFGWQGKLILVLVAAGLLFFVIKNQKKKV
ncbi:MAG: TVP38/TMEM64 family protein [Flavisolibacter sp.]|nr:TVP38/TMEM64 family protein [Flavisolibacter sp.]